MKSCRIALQLLAELECNWERVCITVLPLICNLQALNRAWLDGVAGGRGAAGCDWR